MARIKRLPFLRHVRSEPSRHLMVFRRGRLQRSGRGLAFWFAPLATSLVEVPVDDREIHFLHRARTEDFQDAVVQGSVGYRVVDPEALAARVDFTIDTNTGRHVEQPLERLGDVFTQRAQSVGAEYVAATPIREALADGVRQIRSRLEQSLRGDEELAQMGLEIVAVHVDSVAPSSELEKALQAPTRESIQQRSDEAVFQRRALAVEKERAIRENELHNRIELARREERLIEQEGQNERRRAEELAEAEVIAVQAATRADRLRAETSSEVTRIEAAARAEAERLRAAAEAEGIRDIETSRVAAERERMEIYGELPQHVLLGLAAREFAGKLQRIDRIQLTPDTLAGLLGDLADAGTQLLATHAGAAAETE